MAWVLLGGPSSLSSFPWINKPTIDRKISIAHTTGRTLSRAARRVKEILKTLFEQELDKGWWAGGRGVARR